MKSLRQTIVRHKKNIAVAAAFLWAYGFFQFAYPYHLIRREQMALFLFDWDYIGQTYRGTGWMSRFASDFLEQFFLLPVAGPLIVSLLLTAIGLLVYRICNRHLNHNVSLSVAALSYLWCFLRETGNLYTTRYTLAVTGYLLIVLAISRLKRNKVKPVFSIFFLGIGIWALGLPVHRHYGRLISIPRFNYERLIGLDTEVALERWDKVIRLSEKDLYMTEASYCYNLAQAMKGNLSESLMNHSQNGASTLLLRVSTDRTVFSNTLAGEAWFQLGCMTIAEQSAIISLQASPNHTGARYIKRLAKVNLISGEYAAAQKYLNLLTKTLFYRKWAQSVMPGHQSEITRMQFIEAGMRMAKTDFVHHSDEIRAILQEQIRSNPQNIMARHYLLCYDLLSYDLEQFIEDYSGYMLKGHIYQEAILIWLSQHNRLTEQNAARYGVDNATANMMQRFFLNPDKYPHTYWYYYMKALEEEDNQ